MKGDQFQYNTHVKVLVKFKIPVHQELSTFFDKIQEL